MNSAATPPPVPRRPSALICKMLVIGVLVLALLIPLAMIRSVLDERLERRDAAIAEITSTWGPTQIVAGPVLVVPYRYPVKTWKDQAVAGRTERVEVTGTAIGRAFFLPAEFEAEGVLSPEVRYRGIYRAVVYRARLALSGAFRPPSFEEWKIPPEDVMWEDAFVFLSVEDLRGAQGVLAMQWDNRPVQLTPAERLSNLRGVEARLRLDGPMSAPTRFRLELTLNGSGGLRIAPVGDTTLVRLSSTWPDPSFQGAFLPTEREIGPDGFRAQWQVSYYGRGYPPQWVEKEEGGARAAALLPSSLLGVDLISLLDAYRYVERSIKYGALIIVLVFTAFFLFEALSRVRVHPFPYVLVGAALCLFYLALLSLSEFLPFGWAYLIGAAAATLLISWYAAAVLRGGRRGAYLALGLALVYAFLYVILRLQDYSLLLGTIGLFLVLALVMAATRRVDWYAREAADGDA